VEDFVIEDGGGDFVHNVGATNAGDFAMLDVTSVNVDS